VGGVRVFTGVAEMQDAVGEHLGWSGWHTVTQRQIDSFADSTGDHQWIHVDPEAAARGPFGATIAHGYLTLSLVPVLTEQVYRIEGISMGVNYGADRLRFPSPVVVGSQVRAGVELLSVTPGPESYRVVERVTVELADGGKPACVVDAVSLVVP
jgi:acyl dehydratase